jgi:hypothetical protein
MAAQGSASRFARRQVELMGGVLEVRSTPGQGALFPSRSASAASRYNEGQSRTAREIAGVGEASRVRARSLSTTSRRIAKCSPSCSRPWDAK